MNFMKKLLFHLLMLAVIMPGFTCGPFMMSGKAHAAASFEKERPCCPEMAMSKKPANNHGTMLFKDCAKVDLFGADHVAVKKADPGKTLLVAWADTTAHKLFTPAGMDTIRGPPPDNPGSLETKPSIFLTTLRLRR